MQVTAPLTPLSVTTVGGVYPTHISVMEIMTAVTLILALTPLMKTTVVNTQLKTYL